MESLIFIAYSFLMLEKFMLNRYYQHHLLLVQSITRLFSGHLSWKELDKIEQDLVDYVKQFQVLYGSEFIIINIHNLTHVVECTRLHGPFYLYTCFPYESFNRIVVATIHGSNNCEVQASKAIGTYQFIHQQLRDIKDVKAIEYLARMKFNIYSNEREEMSIDDINTFNVHSEEPGKIFYKSIRVNGTLYEAKDLIVRRNYNNYTIQLKDRRYAEINKL